MRKNIVQKGNIRRDDFMRVVVTDTLPEEVPWIFSNDGFYVNRRYSRNSDPQALDFVEKIMSAEKPYTVPYRYSVVRDSSSTRGLSLIHPAAQEAVARFYLKYDALICDQVKKSVVSLRSPQKVGSTFFVRSGFDVSNNHRRATVDTVTIEKSVSNPASYFAYNRYSRAHQFFDSNDYVHLEKKFSIFRTLDVSKCFNSIYTHTLFWAVCDVETAKNNTSAAGFSNEFDQLMQFMNYRETNGICIGPEVSRIFAEIIFSEIDRRVVQDLAKRECIYKTDFEFRRYVDDYYIFCRDGATADRVTGAIQAALAGFNLHLNEAKAVTLQRPFATKISRIISDTNVKLSSLFEKFVRYKTSTDPLITVRFAYPAGIARSDSLLRLIISEIKSVCATHEAGYEVISDYVISAFTKRIVDIVDGFEHGVKLEGVGTEEYISSIMFLLEATYFFYTVNPTVRSSLNLAKSVVISVSLFQSRFPDRYAFLSESVVRWTLDLARSMTASSRHKDLAAVPIEVLNILLPMREVAENEPLIDELVGNLCKEVESFEYFQIVSFLFVVGPSVRHRILVNKLFVQAKAVVLAGGGPMANSQAAHMCLDLLACPYLPLDKRASWFNTLRKMCGLGMMARQQAQAVVQGMEAHPWFVRWEGADLLSILRKKELSFVY